MYYYPYNNMQMNRWYRNTPTNQADSYIRLFHASPGAPAVDVYSNGNLIAQNLGFKGFTPYLPVAAGNHKIKIYPAGRRENPIIDTDVYIPKGTIFNIAAVGDYPKTSLYYIPEPTVAQNFGRPCIRFIHLSPSAPKVDVKISDDGKVFSDIGYKDITDYVCVPTGTYTFNVTPTGSNDVVLTIPNVKLEPNNYYTIYAVGKPGSQQPLQAVVAKEPR